MSNRFHNKYHRDNHHSKRTAKNNGVTDAAYDPIASYAEPFQGEFFSDGEIVTNSFLSAIGDIHAKNAYIKNNLTVSGNLSVLGEFSRLDTYVYATSAVDIHNAGTGPALKVTQTGMQPIAHFIDSNGDDIVFADNGFVGLGTYTPEEKLTVRGNASVSGSTVISDKLYFGTAGIGSDTNLYRSSANTLKTDDKLIVGTVATDGSNDNILVLGPDNSIRKRTITSQSWNTPANFLSGVDLTLDYVPRYADNQKFVNSIIYNEGMRVGIDNESPTETLDVNGTVLFSTASANVLEVIGKGTGYADSVKGVATIYSENTNAAGGNVLKVGSATNPNNLVVKDNGKVGVNNNPTRTLHVSSADSFNTRFESSHNNATVVEIKNKLKVWENAVASSANVAGVPNNSYYILDQSEPSSPRVVIDGSFGYVGINTNAPNERLTVDGNVQITNDSDPTFIRIQDTNGIDAIWELRSYHAGCSAQGGNNQFSIYGGLQGRTLDDRLVITPDGNVGIGTTDALAKFQVLSGAIMPHIGNTSTAGIQFPSNPGGGAGDTAYIRYYARPGEGENTTFEIGTTNDAQDHISLMASGNVGVGTYYPNKDFTVAGEISSYNVRVTQGAPNSTDNSTNGYAFGLDGDTGVFSPFGPGGAANGNVSLYSNNVEILRSNGSNGVTIFHDLSVTGEIRGNKAFRAVQGEPNDNNNSTNGYAFESDGDTGIFSPTDGGGGVGNGVVSIFSNDEQMMRARAPRGFAFYYNVSAEDAAFRATVGAPSGFNNSSNGYGFGSDGDTGVFSPVLTAGPNNGVVSLYSNSTEILRATGTTGVTVFHDLSVTGTIASGTPSGPIVIPGTQNTVTITNDYHNQTIIINSANPTTITLPAGLRKGLQFSVIRAGAGSVTMSAGTGAWARSTPDNSFNKLGFTNSVASAYLAGTVGTTNNVWYLLGDLLP